MYRCATSQSPPFYYEVAIHQSSCDLQEFILLSDTLGLSLLVESIDHPKPAASTEGTVLGPYHTHDAQDIPPGSSISADPEGEPLLCLCTVKSTSGAPIKDAKVSIWETDSHGVYDVEYEHYTGDKPDGRAVIRSDDEGVFWFKAIVPVPYSIPDDGPVGQMLRLLGRHSWRPSHMHFMFEKAGFDHLTTCVLSLSCSHCILQASKTDLSSALYLRGDPYETSDAVFGVKESLIIDLTTVNAEQAKKYDIKEGSKLLTYDFVLVTEEETKKLRDEEALKAMEKLGREGMTITNGLLVLDVD
jgi:protocatechuate 3,4-dioxygenase beta subunit